ncbi:plasmid mobilization protein [Anaerotignum sp.]|uniref:plasmid mobilization protein n=1 Tax=Anaerotignum sp. TaxID=2039241 RepID=UPI00289CD470|nr:plasmid mobilization relaxosome protein MobC [Anaerotignum sp.]
MSTKKRRLSIKLTQEDFEKIHRKAGQANKNITDYVTTTCLDKEIVIITDLAEVLKELKAVGRNLNQIAVLAHSGRITAVNLSQVLDEMVGINENLKDILERRRWSV